MPVSLLLTPPCPPPCPWQGIHPHSSMASVPALNLQLALQVTNDWRPNISCTTVTPTNRQKHEQQHEEMRMRLLLPPSLGGCHYGRHPSSQCDDHMMCATPHHHHHPLKQVMSASTAIEHSDVGWCCRHVTTPYFQMRMCLRLHTLEQSQMRVPQVPGADAHTHTHKDAWSRRCVAASGPDRHLQVPWCSGLTCPPQTG